MASIPLQFQMPQFENALDLQAKGAQVQNAMGANAMRPFQLKQAQQEVATNDVALQEKQQAAQDQKTAVQILSKYGNDPKAALPELYRAIGVRAAPIAKMLDDAEKAGLETTEKKRAALASIAGSVTDEGSFQRGIDTATASGLLMPSEAASLKATGWTPEVQSAISQIARMGLTPEQQATGARQEVTDRRALNAQQATDMDRTATQNRLANPAPTGEYAEFKALLPGIYASKGIENPTPKDEFDAYKEWQTAKRAPAASKLLTPQEEAQQIRLRQSGALSGAASVPGEAAPLPANWKPGDLNEAALSKYSASAQRLAKQLVNYDVPMPQGIATSREPWVSAIQAASELDPTWKASEYQSRLSARRSFTSGADAKNVTGINTAIGHLQTLADAATKLANSKIPLWNKVANAAASNTGDPRVVRFNIAANAVQNELASVFKGTGATDQEINAWRKTIDAAQSPEQSQGAIKQAVELLGGRMGALRSKWEQAMGRPMDMKVLSPKSRSVLKSMGIDAEALEPSSGVVAVPAPPPAASEDLSKLSTEELMKRLTGAK